MTKAKRLVELIGEPDCQQTMVEREKIMELATMIERIERSISRSLQHYANQHQLTLLDAQSLATILDLGENARLSLIAENVKMPLSTMTGVAARLERAGLVERHRASDDARASVLSLTPEGMERTQKMFIPFFEEVRRVIEQAGPDTMQSIVDAFTIVRDMAEQLESGLMTHKQD